MTSARALILDAAENEREALIDGIKALFNCREADVDEEGDIWVADPQLGHWLNAEKLARVEQALRDGEI